MKESTLRIFDGFAQLQPSGYAADPALEHTIAAPRAVAARALAVPGISAAAPRINGFAILANGARSYGAAGVVREQTDGNFTANLRHRVSLARTTRLTDRV